MTKYHINRNGEPAACRAASKPCPLGDFHYDTREEALAVHTACLKGDFDISLKPWEAEERAVIKAHGGKWQPEEKTWRFPNATAFREAKQAMSDNQRQKEKEMDERAAARVAALAKMPKLSIPYEASEVRAAVKEMGARWNPADKAWSIPAEHEQEARALLEAWQSKQRPARHCICDEMDPEHCPVHQPRAPRVTEIPTWGDQYGI